MGRTHKELIVWQLSVDLVVRIYKVTAKFPKSEIYGLVNQLRRSAISVPSNIAEGAARNSHKEFARFLYIARGSLAELQTQLIVSEKIGFYKDCQLDDQVERIHSLLQGLIRKTLA